MGEPVVLRGEAARAWAGDVARGLGALRLNQHFPPWQRLAAWVRAIAARGEVRLDARSGLPTPREWLRLRVDRDLAGPALAELATVDEKRLGPDDRALLDARRKALIEVQALEDVPLREVHYALRDQDGGRESWLVRVDRFDLATATIARYTLVTWGKPGKAVLELLSTQDAALAFAVLRDREGVDVEEVVRGVVGPGALPDRCGPEAIVGLPLCGPTVSACLERASLDVARGVVDDPLAGTVVVPGEGETFGISRQRKWAAPKRGVEPLKRWLSDRGSRNLVYAA
jgi:hypothetical protein